MVTAAGSMRSRSGVDRGAGLIQADPPYALRTAQDLDPSDVELDRRRNLSTRSHDDPLEIKDRESVVAAALAELNSDQRAALVLVDMQGHAVEEAAQILVCAPGTVKSRCARGRARLVPLLADLERAGE